MNMYIINQTIHKENNFPTLDEFEEYITENFYNSNNVTYSNYKSSGGLHMYDATIVDAENEKSSPITKTFIIKLLDGTDFTMSFNVQKSETMGTDLKICLLNSLEKIR